MAFDTVIDKAKLEGAMTATANAIREKTGNTDSIVWDTNNGFANAVSELTSEEINPSGIIPADIKAAAMEIVSKVNNVRKDDSIVFMAMSDSHHTGEQSDTGWQTLTNLGNLHAGMAAKVLAYALDLDFVCHLGDITFGNGTTTSAQLHQQIAEMNEWLDEAWNGIPRFQTVGNHDTGYYAYTNSSVPLETNDYLFSVFGKYCEGAVYGSETYGYCYRDFEDKKLRVICLNTSEGDSLNASYECSPAQLLWFAQTLKSVGAKTGWNVIVLGHYPLDYVGMHDATAVVKAYVNGSSITVNGTAVNFSGSNNAKFIANFHGHTHCFKVARLNELNVSTKKATEYDAWRVGIPNSGFYRNNHQEGPNAYGLYFEEETTYDKVNDGVNDTAFVVNVITPSEEVIHSFCYGAGYDRAVGYGEVTWYKVTSELTNCTMVSSSTSVEEGKSFTATLIPDEHCAISSIVITMDGVDITESYYNPEEQIIIIDSVTGDIVVKITAAIALACTNQIPISTDENGAIYNAVGYKTKMYCNNGNEGVSTANDLTGFIPCKVGDVIRMENMPFNTTVASCRVSFFKSDKSYISQAMITSTYYMDTVFGGVKDADGNYVQFTITDAANMTTGCAFIRISAADITESSILTVNEEIRYVDELEGSYAIFKDLTNATISNPNNDVSGGSSYITNISVNSGCELSVVTVTMSGLNITANVYSNGKITIPYVTGNIVITVVATKLPTYTNHLPISTDASGAVYNGKGFKENTYISSGNEATKNGTYTSGFIPCAVGNTLYFKNVGVQSGQDGHRFSFYNSSKVFIGLTKTNNTGFTGFTYGSDGNIVSLKIPRGGATNGTAFVRFCGSYIGTDSIVTVNEPID